MKTFSAWAFMVTMLVASSGDAFADSAVWVKRDSFVSYGSPYSAFACSFAEDLAEEVLTKVGAKDIALRCAGGLPQNAFSISLGATYNAATTQGTRLPVENARWERVSLRGEVGCTFSVRLITELLKGFEIRNMRKSNFCWEGGSGSYRFEFDVLKITQ